MSVQRCVWLLIHFLFVPLAAYQEMIPFVKPAPIDEMEAKKQAKKGAAEKKETKGEE